eukprot:scaffold93821_cov21-Cyclotella_meneghiniana.AAC.2
MDEISSSTDDDERGVGGRTSDGLRHDGERNAWHDGSRRRDRLLERMGNGSVSNNSCGVDRIGSVGD